jgi:Flp pilus assembly protein TadG
MRKLLRAHGGRGQALVEFAIVAPVFFLLLFGLIDLGRYVYVTNAFGQAAREGARFGAVQTWIYSCPASVSPVNRQACTAQETRNRMGGAPAYFNVTVTCTSPDGLTIRNLDATGTTCLGGDLLKVVVATPTSPSSQRFQFFTPFIGQLIGSPVVSATSQAIIQ